MQLVVGVAILRSGTVLAARRAGPRGGWEFPGGKVEAGESPTAAAVREIAEELGCQIEVTDWLAPTVPIRPGLELRVAVAVLVAGEPTAAPGVHEELRWLAAAELDTVTWLAADQPFVAELTATRWPGSD